MAVASQVNCEPDIKVAALLIRALIRVHKKRTSIGMASSGLLRGFCGVSCRKETVDERFFLLSSGRSCRQLFSAAYVILLTRSGP